MLLEKTTRMNFLFDFYQALLTEKQRSYMDLYYLNDLSLGEIAEQYEISRQAVYDNIRRTEAMLEEYEQKLQLFSKFRQRLEAVDALVADVEQGGTDAGDLVRRLHELKEFD
ncbi:putative DNA-binding protein [Bhargavaea massiliensis]|uniref:putative DNA-binding protein n=1 Tax=Bhargavaea massiliensis TaxID=2697500 RepID=UPI001BCE7A51|nr:putative DNA-binding protein [Bhargavaea massiliensis]